MEELKEFLETLDLKLKLIEKHIFNINSDYIINKVNEDKDKYALEFLYFYKMTINNEYDIYINKLDKERLEIFKKEKGYL